MPLWSSTAQHPGTSAPRTGTVEPVMSDSVPPAVLAQDPTGLSSPFGQIVVLIGLLASLTLLLRWWWQNRGR